MNEVNDKNKNFKSVKIITLPKRKWALSTKPNLLNGKSHPFLIELKGSDEKLGNSIEIRSDHEYDLGDIINLTEVDGQDTTSVLIYFSEAHHTYKVEYRLEWKPPYIKGEVVGTWSVVSSKDSSDYNLYVEEPLILLREDNNG